MRFRLILLGLLTLSAVGCGRVHYVRYLTGVDFDPENSRGLPLEFVYANDDVVRLKGGRILVQVENPAKTIERSVSKVTPKLDEEDNWDKLRLFYELKFMTALDTSEEFADVRRATYATSEFHPDATLKVAITEWHEGNKWLRAYGGFGMGATRVQWEGQLIDNRTKQVVFAFADARIHPGGPSFMGFPPKVWRGPDLITEDLAYGAKDLAETLRTVIEMPAKELVPNAEATQLAPPQPEPPQPAPPAAALTPLPQNPLQPALPTLPAVPLQPAYQ